MCIRDSAGSFGVFLSDFFDLRHYVIAFWMSKDNVPVSYTHLSGVIHNKAKIADLVEKGQDIALICTEDGEEIPVLASLDGVLRGLIREGYQVFEGMKIADIDPRKEQKKNCNTISDKARCIAGSVVEILLSEGIFP